MGQAHLKNGQKYQCLLVSNLLYRSKIDAILAARVINTADQQQIMTHQVRCHGPRGEGH